jgi:dTMP kinase
LRTREPGGAPGAEEIRRLLVEGAPQRWDAETEALLIVAARRNHLVETVWPALDRGEWVVCDRFADSTLAYQGYGRGLPQASLASLHSLIAQDFKPDLTLILDLPVDIGLSRAAQRAGSANRFERMGTDFHERLRRGFQEIARAQPQRCVLIDATADIGAVQQAIRAAVRTRLGVAI